MNNKVLSIIVPSYKTLKYMNECLPHYVSEFLRKKIIVYLIDDGSPDDSLECAKSFEKKYPDLFVAVHKENGGHGSVINCGVEMVDTKYFKVIDGDDWPDTQSLEDLVAYLEQSDDDLVISDCVGFDNNNNKVIYKGVCEEIVLPKKTYDIHFLKYFNISIHRITFKTLYYKSYNQKLTHNVFYEDAEYTLLFLKHLSTISYFNEPVYFYRQSNSEQSTSVKSLINHYKDFQIVFSRILSELFDNECVNNDIMPLIINSLKGSMRLWYLLILCQEMPLKHIKEEIKQLDRKLKSYPLLYKATNKFRFIKAGRFLCFSPIFLFRKIAFRRF